MRYIVKASFRQAPNPDILALLPAERARADELMRQGLMVALYVAADYSTGWSVYDTESRDNVEHALETLPLHPFLDVEITPLAE